MSDDVELGPIDLVVIGYPKGAPMTGEGASIMVDLVQRGIIRVLDATIVVKEEDGTFTGLSVTDMDQDRAGDFVIFEGATTGLIGDEDLAMVAELMEPGDAAAAILYENRWAAPFASAVRRSGGRLIMSERIGAQDLMDAIEMLGD
ncbi:MAG: DUF6325 family protein [Thermoleophilia bacterium]|jgi:hypothetical protein